LTRALVADGHAVRGTTRDLARRAAIEAAGAEAFVGDPDRVATVAPALDHATVLCVLLGSATGSAAHVAALHSTRLEMLLQRTLDSTVRGIVYEAAGTLDGPVLERGAEAVTAACEDSHIPYVLLRTDPADHDAWSAAAVAAVDRVLGGGTFTETRSAG
jgi:uncharacterized protein YbjT (DUF2867 family)